MIYMIGVCHNVQCYNKDDQIVTEFSKKIEDICQDNGIEIIVEEYSEEAIKDNGCEDSALRKMSNHLEIQHAFCDPDRELRKKMGISDIHANQINGFLDAEFNVSEANEENFAKREAYWLEMLLQNDPENKKILFVCGNDHTENMIKKFESSNIKYTNLSE